MDVVERGRPAWGTCRERDRGDLDPVEMQFDPAR